MADAQLSFGYTFETRAVILGSMNHRVTLHVIRGVECASDIPDGDGILVNFNPQTAFRPDLGRLRDLDPLHIF